MRDHSLHAGCSEDAEGGEEQSFLCYLCQNLPEIPNSKILVIRENVEGSSLPEHIKTRHYVYAIKVSDEDFNASLIEKIHPRKRLLLAEIEDSSVRIFFEEHSSVNAYRFALKVKEVIEKYNELTGAKVRITNLPTSW